MMNSDGSNPQSLNRAAAPSSWSPDGQFLVFTSYGMPYVTDFIKADGTFVRHLSHKNHLALPSWHA